MKRKCVPQRPGWPPLTRKAPFAALAVATLGLSAALAPGTSPASEAHLERQVLGYQQERAGEPEIAIDPTNPDNVFFVNAACKNCTYSDGPAQAVHAPSGLVTYATSFDRGDTWSYERELPVLVPGQVYDRSGDGIAAYGPDGTLYAGAVVTAGGVAYAAIAVIRSSDKGRTWSLPSYLLVEKQAIEITLGGMKPAPIIWDRPWITVDQSTGVLYVSTTSHLGRFVTASHDEGRHWTKVRLLESAEYPSWLGDGHIDSAHGVLAAVYTASRGPGAENCGFCVVFETSTDDGATWARSLVPAAEDVSDPHLAADPSRPGRYAVMVTTGTDTALNVFITTDSGLTWSDPAVLAEGTPPPTINRPWIDFSPAGVLGVLWRARFSDRSQDVFTAIALAGGNAFSQPLKVNLARSPAPDPTQVAIDDVSHIQVHGESVYAGWGDWRSGDMAAWFGRIDFSEYGVIPAP